MLRGRVTVCPAVVPVYGLLLALALLPPGDQALQLDHNLVKRYFIELYNQALVRAMQQQQQEQNINKRKSSFTPYKSHDIFKSAAVKAPSSSSGFQSSQPQAHWKGGPPPAPPHHKHKHHTHHHQHKNTHQHKHSHKHDNQHQHKHSAKHKHVHKHEHHHEHNHHHKHKDEHQHGHDHKHGHKHVHSHKTASWRRRDEDLPLVFRRKSILSRNEDIAVPSGAGTQFDQHIFRDDNDGTVFTDYHDIEYDAWEQI